MFFYKLRRIFCMFKNLVTNDIVKFFVFKRKMLSICIYKYLMWIYFYISASMVIIIDKLFNNNISSMGWIMSGANFNNFITPANFLNHTLYVVYVFSFFIYLILLLVRFFIQYTIQFLNVMYLDNFNRWKRQIVSIFSQKAILCPAQITAFKFCTKYLLITAVHSGCDCVKPYICVQTVV